MKSALSLSTLRYVLVVAGITAACDLRTNRSNQEESPGELRTLSESLSPEGVESVTARLSMGAGKLLVTGGAHSLMEADFEYNYESWRPEISFEQNGSQGDLSIEQPNLTDNLDINLGDNQRNEWRIRLNDQVPLDLKCKIGAGETDLDLQGLNLSSVDIDAGVGKHTIVLTNTHLAELSIDAGVGEVNIDLRGAWNNNLRADIDGGIGALNLQVPANVGVRLEVSGGLGSVDVPSGYSKDGNTYTNAAYEQAEHRLDIDVDAGLGSIEVEEE